MADMTKFKPDGVTQLRVTRLTGWILLANTGTITSQSATSTATSGGQQCGVTWTHPGAGQFSATLHRGYKRFIRGDAQVIAVSAGVSPLTAAGIADASLNLSSSALATGATPVPVAGGIGIVTMNAAGAATDPTAAVLVTYDIELSDI